MHLFKLCILIQDLECLAEPFIKKSSNPTTSLAYPESHAPFVIIINFPMRENFFQHIFQHLKNEETVTCVFKDCAYKTNIYENFKSHKYRKKSDTCNAFKSGISKKKQLDCVETEAEVQNGKLQDAAEITEMSRVCELS